MGKLLLAIGILLALVGGLIMLMERLGAPLLGKLPGDIVVQKENFAFYFPLASSLVLSVLLSLLLWALSRIR